jgi:ABC-2 type transport system permease protein
MKTLQWLLRREFWENKGSMFWAPLVVAAIMFLTLGGTLVYGVATHGTHVWINGHDLHAAGAFSNLPPETRSEIVNAATSGYLATSVPLFLMLGVVVFWYCLGALYDERRDRSILFWKSLPVSDRMTVLSKVITAACVTPVITIATATALSLALLLLGCAALAFNGTNVFTAVLASPHLYLAPLALLSLLPVYVVWAVPTIGWLLLVSSWARSKVFLWATGVPLITLIIMQLISVLMLNVFNSDSSLTWIVRDVVARLLSGVIPGIWFAYDGTDPVSLQQTGHGGIDIAAVVSHSWMTLASVDPWIGVAGGVAMICAAMRLRRWRDEG